MFVTRQSKNLQRVLTSAKVKNENGVRRPVFEQGAGSHKCSGCHACKVVQNSKIFKSNNTKRKYSIRQKMSCRSSYIIYLIKCKNFGGNYVGKSKREFRQRHSGHKQEITNRIGGLGLHFHPSNSLGCSYDHLEATLIEKVNNGDDALMQSWLRGSFIGNINWGHSKKMEGMPWIWKMTYINPFFMSGGGIISRHQIRGQGKHKNVWGCHYPPPLTPVITLLFKFSKVKYSPQSKQEGVSNNLFQSSKN